MARRPPGKGKPRVVRRRIAKRRRQPTTNVNRSLQPIPSRYICKMKYADVLTTSVTTGGYVMNLNSLFDPDRSGIGHQPYAYDNLSTLYNRYRVVSCSWRIAMPGTTGSNPITWSSIPSNDSSILWSNLGEVLENPRAKYITQNPGAPVTYLRGKSYIPALMGRTRQQYMADDKYQADVLSSPSELALLYINSFNASGGIAGGVTFSIVMEYTVEFFDIKHVTQS